MIFHNTDNRKNVYGIIYIMSTTSLITEMNREIRNTEDIYNVNLDRLADHVHQRIRRVQSVGIPPYYRNIYIRRIRAWENYQKRRLAKIRHETLESIRRRYNKSSERRKQACLVGINYNGTNYALNGCVNDVYSFRQLLINKYGYDPKDIQMIINRHATRETILNEFAKLVENAVSGDTICFSFSGHGIYVRDRGSDESDNRDELVISADFRGILDDEFKSILVKNLKPGVRMFALFDNCHSGTILDLRYQHLKSGNPELKIYDEYSDTASQVVCISGCQDNQVSMDAYLNGQYNGAMTWALVQTLTQNPDVSWEEGLNQVRSKLTSRGFKQIPQLTSGRTLSIGEEKWSI